MSGESGESAKIARVLAEHEPVIDAVGLGGAIVGCSCLSVRQYRAAGNQAGQAGYRDHLARVLAETHVMDRATELRDLAAVERRIVNLGDTTTNGGIFNRMTLDACAQVVAEMRRAIREAPPIPPGSDGDQ